MCKIDKQPEVDPPLRILFAEVVPINTTVGTSLLKKLGHDVVTVVNGRDCIAALKDGKFDLVLMDIQMPIMNGEDAQREIRRYELGTDYHQPIIAQTAMLCVGIGNDFWKRGDLTAMYQNRLISMNLCMR